MINYIIEHVHARLAQKLLNPLFPIFEHVVQYEVLNTLLDEGCTIYIGVPKSGYYTQLTRKTLMSGKEWNNTLMSGKTELGKFQCKSDLRFKTSRGQFITGEVKVRSLLGTNSGLGGNEILKDIHNIEKGICDWFLCIMPIQPLSQNIQIYSYLSRKNTKYKAF